MLLRKLLNRCRHYRLKLLWRRGNSHNSSNLGSCTDIDYISVRNGTYGTINVLNHNCTNCLKIGAYCSIAPSVAFIVCSEHELHNISTFPFKVILLKSQEYEAKSRGDIIVQDDVWIGYGATILSGVHIGQGAVVAAGAVVSKDVPPYAIVGGVPAKIIRYRFEQPVIDFLLTLDYGKLDETMIRTHVNDLYKSIDGMALDEVKRLFDWFPKKGTKA